MEQWVFNNPNYDPACNFLFSLFFFTSTAAEENCCAAAADDAVSEKCVLVANHKPLNIAPFLSPRNFFYFFISFVITFVY